MKQLLFTIFAISMSLSAWAAQPGVKEISVTEFSQNVMSEFSFGPTWIGHTEYAKILIKNEGAQAVQLKKISKSGSGFSVVANCPAQLQPGQSCAARVRFNPAFEGIIYSGKINFLFAHATATVKLSGWGMR